MADSFELAISPWYVRLAATVLDSFAATTQSQRFRFRMVHQFEASNVGADPSILLSCMLYSFLNERVTNSRIPRLTSRLLPSNNHTVTCPTIISPATCSSPLSRPGIPSFGLFFPIIHMHFWIDFAPRVLVRDFWGGASACVVQSFQVGGFVVGRDCRFCGWDVEFVGLDGGGGWLVDGWCGVGCFC